MKFVTIQNTNKDREISIAQVVDQDGRPLKLAPGETRKVSPATAAHPVVRRHLNAGLRIVEEGSTAPTPTPVVPALVIPKLEEKDISASPAAVALHDMTASSVVLSPRKPEPEPEPEPELEPKEFVKRSKKKAH